MSTVKKMQIQTTPVSLALNLTKEEREIVLATTSMFVKDLSDAEFINSLVDILSKAYFDVGQSPKGDTDSEKMASLKAMTLSLIQDLREYFPAMTIDEVRIAVNRGIRNYYGEYYGINVKEIHNFCRSYKQSEERNEALRKQAIHRQEQELESETKKISESEEHKIMSEACQSALDGYLKTGKLIDFGSAKYMYLERKGLINLTIERKKEIYERAKAEVKIQKAMEPVRNSIELIRGGKDIPDHEIIAHARYIALREYFDYCKEFEVNIKQQLNH